MEKFTSEFRTALEWIDRYLSGELTYPVLSQVLPGEVARALPSIAPEEPDSFAAIFHDFDATVLPGITHWNSPRFFAYFATSAAPVGVIAEALAAALDVKAMLWRTSPAATELEEVTMVWLRELLGLPQAFTGIIYDTASIAGFTALAGAREALDLGIRERGMTGRDLPVLRVYITGQTHSHIEKAAIALGIGRENVVHVPCDEAFAMDVSALEQVMRDDVAAGRRPMAVVPTIGTTSTTSRDPVEAIVPVARRYGAWVHVDAAYAGVAAIVPEYRYVLAGADAVDSLVVNPHKWLFVPMDLSVLFVRDTSILRRAFSLVPEYLRTNETGVTNFMDYGLQLGRRFRALKLWFVLRYYGAEGIRAHLRRHMELAQTFASWIETSPGWELMAPVEFSVVCFRRHPSGTHDEAELERMNEALLQALNGTGEAFLSHTKLNGLYVLRLAIGNLRTQREDVEAVWRLLQQLSRESEEAASR